ncbi:hypothetical protein, partial [Helicobacter sp. T3_23-1056]
KSPKKGGVMIISYICERCYAPNDNAKLEFARDWALDLYDVHSQVQVARVVCEKCQNVNFIQISIKHCIFKQEVAQKA